MRLALLVLGLIALVLVPFFLFEEQFNALGKRIARGDVSTWLAAAAIGALLALDVFLPVPSSIVSTAAGVLLGLWRGAALVWIGMMAACVLGYALGSRSSRAARWLVGAEGLDRAAQLANRYGDLALVLCRPIPVLAEASVIFAGIIRAPFGRFVRLTAWSNLGIAVGYTAIGAFSVRVESFLVAFIGAVAIPAVALAVAKVLVRRGA